jgi:hypothetical protein
MDMQSGLANEEPLDFFTAVNRPPIPQQNHRPGHVAEELPQEGSHMHGLEVVLLESGVQADAPPDRADRKDGQGRDAVVFVAITNLGRMALRAQVRRRVGMRKSRFHPGRPAAHPGAVCQARSRHQGLRWGKHPHSFAGELGGHDSAFQTGVEPGLAVLRNHRERGGLCVLDQRRAGGRIEVWAIDRRSNLLEDLQPLIVAENANEVVTDTGSPDCSAITLLLVHDT